MKAKWNEYASSSFPKFVAVQQKEMKDLAERRFDVRF